MRQTVKRIETFTGWAGETSIPILACGHSHGSRALVGESVECQRCDWQAEAEDKLRALVAAGMIAHTRADRLGKDVHAYTRDTSSPTGVWRALTLEETPTVRAILRDGLAPLSPTERS